MLTYTYAYVFVALFLHTPSMSLCFFESRVGRLAHQTRRFLRVTRDTTLQHHNSSNNKCIKRNEISMDFAASCFKNHVSRLWSKQTKKYCGSAAAAPESVRAAIECQCGVCFRHWWTDGASSRTPSSLPAAAIPPPFASYERFASISTPLFQPTVAAPYSGTFRSLPPELVQHFGRPPTFQRPRMNAPAPYSLPAVDAPSYFDPGPDDAAMVAALEAAERVNNMPPVYHIEMPPPLQEGASRKDPPSEKMPSLPFTRGSRIVFSDADNDSDTESDEDNVSVARKRTKTTTESSSGFSGIVCSDG